MNKKRNFLMGMKCQICKSSNLQFSMTHQATTTSLTMLQSNKLNSLHGTNTNLPSLTNPAFYKSLNPSYNQSNRDMDSPFRFNVADHQKMGMFLVD